MSTPSRRESDSNPSKPGKGGDVVMWVRNFAMSHQCTPASFNSSLILIPRNHRDPSVGQCCRASRQAANADRSQCGCGEFSSCWQTTPHDHQQQKKKKKKKHQTTNQRRESRRLGLPCPSESD